MLLCGLKLTHDGGVAVVENNRLLFSIEFEKLNNNPRYSGIEDTADISRVLECEGLKPSDIDMFAIDGWGGYDDTALAVQPRLQLGKSHNMVSATNRGNSFHLPVAHYEERVLNDDVLRPSRHEGLQINNETFVYESYLHVAGHILSAYCTSPFSVRNEDSYILVWDGGMYPRLYYFNAETRSIRNLGPIFLLIGNVYTIFSQHFGPFKVSNSFAKDSLSVAGKVMAYIALGETRKEWFQIFDDIYRECYGAPMGFANTLAIEFKKRITGGYTDEDVLATFHSYMAELLVNKLQKKVHRDGNRTHNLCLVGGCALNIKWNSVIRNSGHFKEVYVPPFPNDSGSAIGMACALMINHQKQHNLQWSVFSGPSIIKNAPNDGWEESCCTPEELAQILHQTNQPIVFLNGRSELGPRALGNRSLIASACSPQMKELLNEIKRRENYRPVSPICLEDRSAEIFQPGLRDPFMLFDHNVSEEWRTKIPAICHLDYSARLQTINSVDNEIFANLLTAYEKLSGVPLLCNTSANFNGRGFFPDVYSATKWNMTKYVWCEGSLYTNLEKCI
jgi:carbamoyltransferase